MKLTHHVPKAAYWQTEPVTPQYQADVDRATNRLAVAHEAAKRRLEKAQQRLDDARKRAGARSARKDRKRRDHAVAVALELVELRREELLRIEALMMNVPASATHRGVKSYRPVPPPGSAV